MGEVKPYPVPPESHAGQRFDSWKEIAAYLNREVRTVQRWEREEGLPVHRHAHKKLGTVFALRAEIDEWARGRRTLLEKDALGPALAPRRVPAWAVAAVAVGVAGGGFAGWLLSRPAANAPLIRVEIALPGRATLLHGSNLAVSPDGKMIVLAASGGLWLRNLEETHARLLPNTADGIGPFWAPDGREIGFFAAGKLRKLTLPDGAPETLADARDPQGAAWSEKGVIVFAPNREGPLLRIPAGGGTAVPATQLDPGRQEYLHSAPSFLPDGSRFLFFARSRQRQNDAVLAGSLDAAWDFVRAASPFPSASGAIYAAGEHAAQGHLLYLKEGNLVAQGFDLKALKPSGAIRVVARRVRYSDSGVVNFGVSASGLLAYAADDVKPSQPQWVGRDGRILGSVGVESEYLKVRPSPDQRKVATIRVESSDLTKSLWCLDLVRGVDTKLASGDDIGDPTWSPDGTRLAFMWDKGGLANIYTSTLDGSSVPQPLLPLGRDRWPLDWSPNGRVLLYAEVDPVTKSDVWAFPVSGGAPAAILRGPHKENEARFSPDGKLIAYQSDESGHVQVYLETFPPGGGKWQVSVDHGAEPRWRADGRELFYLSGDDAVMAAPVRTFGALAKPGPPVRLFGGRFSRPGQRVWKFEPSPDGQRFLILTPNENAEDTPVHLVLNWRAGLR